MSANLADMINAYMKQNRWSFRKLAPRIGISSATLNRASRGEQIDGVTQLKLINWIFGVTP